MIAMNDMRLFLALICVGCLFSLLAAMAAFVISYDEWAHHFPGNRNNPFWHALEVALVTFLVLSMLISVGVYGIGWIILH